MNKQLVVIIIALSLRLINLNSSFWLDEAAQVLESIRPLSEQYKITHDFQPPLYHYVVHFFLLVSRTEWWLRLASLVPGLITVWLTMILGKKLYNEKIGLIAGLLLATSQFHVFYSQELRPYSMSAMWVLVAFYAYYKILNRNRYSLPLFVVGLTAGMYTTYLFPLLLIVFLIITAVWYRKEINNLIKLLAAAAVLCLPWLPAFLDQLKTGTSYAALVPTWSQIVSPPLWKMLPLVIAKFFIGRINVDLGVIDIAIMAILITATLYLFKGALRFTHTKEILVWLIVPIAMAFLISLKVPVLDPKRLIYCLPALYLLLAAGSTKNTKTLIALSLFLVINISSLIRYATDKNQQREPWREAIQTLEQSSLPNDKVLFSFDAPFAPWEWYQTKQLDTVAFETPPQIYTLEQKIQDAERVYVFDYLHELSDPNQELLSALSSIGYKETGYHQYEGIGKVRLYQRAIPIATINP